MAKEKNVPHDPNEAAAAAALRLYRSGNVSDDDELILNDFRADYLRASQYEPGGWLHGPAHMELFSAGVDRLQRNGAQRGIQGRVTKVRAGKLKQQNLIYIYATTDNDPNGIEVNYQRYGAWINLVTLLGPLRLTERAGYRSRYNLDPMEQTPVGPALVLDLGRRLERRRDWKKGAKSSKKASKPASSAGKSTTGETKA